MKWTIEQRTVTESTNLDVAHAIAKGAGAGLVIWALEQKSGKGRQGRVWHSPVGNLYSSILLRPEGIMHIGYYSFIAALAVADTIKNFLPHADIKLKWPNDVLVGGKKISGILLEVCENALIMGIGINVASHPKDTPYPTTSIVAEGGNNLDLSALLDNLLYNINHWLGIMTGQGFQAVRLAWLQGAQKGAMTVNLPHEKIAGFFETIDEQGNLVLRLHDNTNRIISSGDVFMNRG